MVCEETLMKIAQAGFVVQLRPAETLQRVEFLVLGSIDDQPWASIYNREICYSQEICNGDDTGLLVAIGKAVEEIDRRETRKQIMDAERRSQS